MIRSISSKSFDKLDSSRIFEYSFSTFAPIPRDNKLWEPCYRFSTNINPTPIQQITFLELQTPTDYDRAYSPALSETLTCSRSPTPTPTTPLINTIDPTYHMIATHYDPKLPANQQRLVPSDRLEGMRWTETERKHAGNAEWVSSLSDLRSKVGLFKLSLPLSC